MVFGVPPKPRLQLEQGPGGPQGCEDTCRELQVRGPGLLPSGEPRAFPSAASPSPRDLTPGQARREAQPAPGTAHS